jgi:hypothetical protein
MRVISLSQKNINGCVPLSNKFKIKCPLNSGLHFSHRNFDSIKSTIFKPHLTVMKKIIFVVSLFAVLALSTSCKKNYTCTCTYSTGGGGGYYSSGTTTTLGTFMFDETKSKATTDCTAKQTSFSAYPTGSGVSCVIN